MHSVKFLVAKATYAVVDLAEWPRVSELCWGLSSHGYAESHFKGRSTYLHRFLTDPPKGKVVDHKNGDRLDNRFANLRVCEIRQNIASTSATGYGALGHKNIYHDRGKYHVAISTRFAGKKHIGSFAKLEDAIVARDKARKETFGEFHACSEETVDLAHVPTVGQIVRTTSGYRGLFWHPKHQKWGIRVMVRGKAIYGGYSADKEEAARMYDAKAMELLGEQAKLNFPS